MHSFADSQDKINEGSDDLSIIHGLIKVIFS